MAVCAYILDKDNHLLITRRPSWLNIFPQAWVLPGGKVDFQESFEKACLREIHEEIGINIEPINENNGNSFHIFSTPQNKRLKNPINVQFEPYYLYESVTKNIDEINDCDSNGEEFPPKSQHLVLFYYTKINESYKNLILAFNSSEVQEAIWISLQQLKNAFENKFEIIDGYKVQECTMSYKELNSKVNTHQLYPLYRYNPFNQGLGKGHVLACKYLLRQYGIINQ